MLLDEARRPNWHIVATDVSFHALARAEKGLYTEREIQGLSPERRSKYLTPAPGGYEIAGFLRRKVRFAHHNLSGDDAESLVPEPQVVFCRNVLMYFGREESEACIKRIADRLVAGGHLFLGHSDSPGRMTGYFEPILVAGARCYRRLTAAQPAAPVAGRRQGDLRPPADLHSLLVEGDHAAAAGDLRSAIRAFRSATYLDPDQAVSYFQLASALELAGDEREARRAFAAAGLAMMSEGANGDLSALGGFTRRDLARAIASKLAEDT
jgi:tetratricopeptide (TPR) repeat protein